jgi:hypothetical protein
LLLLATTSSSAGHHQRATTTMPLQLLLDTIGLLFACVLLLLLGPIIFASQLRCELNLMLNELGCD